MGIVLLATPTSSLAGDQLLCASPAGSQSKTPDYIAANATTVKATATFSGSGKTSVCVEISSYMFVDRVECTSTQFITSRTHKTLTCASNGVCNWGIFAGEQRLPSAKPGFDNLCVSYENRSSYQGTATLTVDLH